MNPRMEDPNQLILNLWNPDCREGALRNLSKIARKGTHEDLALKLWGSFGTIAILLKESTLPYPALSPPTLTTAQSNRVCNALELLQCVVSHAYTRPRSVDALIPLYVLPLLNTTCTSEPYELMRLSCLGVFGDLVKVPDTKIIKFLLSTDLISQCLRIMEIGSELSKSAATFIIWRILLDDIGLGYVCDWPALISAVLRNLGNMVAELARRQPSRPSTKLLRNSIRCYLRLSENHRVRETLKTCFLTLKEMIL